MWQVVTNRITDAQFDRIDPLGRFRDDYGEISLKSVERFSAFDGSEIFFEGTLPEVTKAIRGRLAKLPDSQILVFSQTTGRQTDIYLDLPVSCADQTTRQRRLLAAPSLVSWP